MASYFVDTSALVKRYLIEQGTNWLINLLGGSNAVFVARITHPETASAIHKRVRSKTMGVNTQNRLLTLVNYHFLSQYSIIEINGSICAHAVTLVTGYGLRGYDSVQLGCALQANDLLIQAGASPLTFLSADKNLLAAAAAEGLVVDNPENYP